MNHRFINADVPEILIFSAVDLSRTNSFAYCGNNPTNNIDTSGAWFFTAIKAVAGAVVNVITTYVAAKATGQEYTLTDGLVAAGVGAVNAIPGAGPYLAASLSGAYSGYTAYENAASAEATVLTSMVSGFFTFCSISNIANLGNSIAEVLSTVAADLVFGSGYNMISAATLKAAINNQTNQETGAQTMFNMGANHGRYFSSYLTAVFFQ